MQGSDQRRLERYDLFAKTVREDYAKITAQMRELRSQGKTKTATYRQLFANLMTLKEILSRFEDAGL
jgi:ribosomal protein L19E